MAIVRSGYFTYKQSGGPSTTSGNASPLAGDAIISVCTVWNQGSTGTSPTIAGTGTFTPLIPWFSDNAQGDYLFAINKNATAGSQSVTGTGHSPSIGSASVFGFAYSGANNANCSASQIQRANPGTGVGALTGTSVVVPNGAILLCIAVDSWNGTGTLTANGATSTIDSNTTFGYCFSEYAGTGAAITPSFTASGGSQSSSVLDVWQILIPASSGGGGPLPLHNANFSLANTNVSVTSLTSNLLFSQVFTENVSITETANVQTFNIGGLLISVPTLTINLSGTSSTYTLNLTPVFGGAAFAVTIPAVLANISISNTSNSNTWNGQLAVNHWVTQKMPLNVIFPRPDTETSSNAAHRLAYYDAVNPIQYEIPIGIQGGARPLVWTVLAGPPGMTIGSTFGNTNYGIVTWTPNAVIAKASPTACVVQGKGQDGNTVNVTWNVATSNSLSDFIFISPSGTGNGAFSNTTNINATMGNLTTKTFPGARVYMTNGSYVMPLTSNSLITGSSALDLGLNPIVYRVIPGANAFIDMSQAQLFDNGNGCSDLFFSGSTNSRMTMNSSSATSPDTHTFEMYSPNRVTWFNIDFTNPISRVTSITNSTSLFSFNNSSANNVSKNNWYVYGCTETGRPSGAGNSMLLLAWFDVQNFVVEFCAAQGSPGFGMFFKDSNRWGTVFRCIADLLPESSSSGGAFLFGGQEGGQTSSFNLEVCYCYVRGGAIKFDFQGGAHAQTMWSYRNTVYRTDTNEAYGVGTNGGVGPYFTDSDVLVAKGPTLVGVGVTGANTEVQASWNGGSPPPTNNPINVSSMLLSTFNNSNTGALVNSTTSWRTTYLGTRGWEIF